MAMAAVFSIAAPAAELVVNDKVWASLPPKQQQQILGKLAREGVLKKEDTLRYQGPNVVPLDTRMSPQMLAKLAERAIKIVCEAKFDAEEQACIKSQFLSPKEQCIARIQQQRRRSASCRR
jgi:hypothetical protein